MSEQQDSGLNIHLFIVNLLEKLIDLLKRVMTVNILDFCSKWISMIGHYAIMGAAFFGFIFTFIYAIRTNEFSAFLKGLAWIPLIFIAQYTAHKFLKAGDKLIKNNPTQLASRAFVDCFAFLAMIAGLIMFIMAIVDGIRAKSFTLFLIGLGMAVLMELLALVAFNPKSINIDIVEKNTAGQEALAIITFSIKAVMRLIPILFGIGVTVGTIVLFFDIFDLFGEYYQYVLARVTMTSGSLILVAALLPFLSYVAFAILYLFIDVIKAQLSIPEKLDKLNK